MLMRPPSRPRIAILNPSPSAPSRLPSGMTTPSRLICLVGWLFQPIFCSLRPYVMPGASPGTRKLQTPPAPACTPFSSSSRAITTSTSVEPAPEMNAFVPVSTYSSPRRLAIVFSDAASDPALGSVKQYDASFSPVTIDGHHCALSASEPNVAIIHNAMLWIVMYAVVDVQPAASSSTIRLASRRDSPSPPSATGVYSAQKPSSPARRITSFGKCCSSSQRAA